MILQPSTFQQPHPYQTVNIQIICFCSESVSSGIFYLLLLQLNSSDVGVSNTKSLLRFPGERIESKSSLES